jgi:hypothetical protein
MMRVASRPSKNDRAGVRRPLRRGPLIDGPGSSPLVITMARGWTRPERGTSLRSTATAWRSIQPFSP